LFSPKRPDRLLRPTEPYFRYVPRLFSGEEKWPGRENNHPSPFRVEIKNEWSCTYNPPICLQGLDMEHLSLPLPLHWQFI